MKTIIGVGLGLFALLGLVSLSEKAARPNLQSDEWRRRHRWPDGGITLDGWEMDGFRPER